MISEQSEKVPFVNSFVKRKKQLKLKLEKTKVTDFSISDKKEEKNLTMIC